MKGPNGVEYNGQLNPGGLTYSIAEGAVEGDAVTLVSGFTMGRGADGAPFDGKLQKIEKDGLCDVDDEGVMVVRCVAGLTAGRKPLVVDGAGKIKAGAAGAGRMALVIGIIGTDAIVRLS